MVLLDVIMPDMGGFQACAALSGTGGADLTPIFIITGQDDTALDQPRLRGGCDGLHDLLVPLGVVRTSA